jgi:hypothetical protein
MTTGICQRVLLIALTAVPVGCEGLLDVENPASINDEDIRRAEGAELWANGALRTVQEGWDGMLAVASASSDELTFVGPHGWWGELDRGNVATLTNNALNREYRPLASGEWMAREALHVLDSLDAAGELGDPEQESLSRTYLYSAIVNTALADWMEDYAPSNRIEGGDALGPENMDELFEKAINHATLGLAIASDEELERNLLAARARARHAQRVRERVYPPPADQSEGGFVADASAVDDAEAALANDPGDWRYEFLFEPSVVGSTTAAEMNCLINLRVGDVYARPTPDNLRAGEIILLDPIDQVPDPWLEEFVFAVQEHPGGGCANVPLTAFSAREMHLIVAEDALARGDLDTFAEQVNTVRSARDLTPWMPDSDVSARDLLIYERQTQLFLTGRRLTDMYRFGVTSETWDPGSAALQAPGTLFPIPQGEIEANCHLNGSC